MATEIINLTAATDVVTIDDDDDDDEISVLYSKPPAPNGSSNKNPIPVERYNKRNRRKKNTFIDLSIPLIFDDEVKILFSSSSRKIFKGECSNSKSKSKSIIIEDDDDDDELTELSKSKILVCEICADDKPSSEMFRILGCSHFYCTQCISSYVGAKLQDNTTKITCPVPKCVGFLEPYHCRSILPKEVFDRWGDALCEAVILGSERFYCPYKDCSALLIDDGSSGNGGVVHSECPHCNKLFCVKCKVPWHTGVTCVEFQRLGKDERSNEDLKLMQLAKQKNWQRCARCGFYVEKKDGCLFMKCRCSYCFCYHCGAEMAQHLHYCTKCKR